MSSDSVVAVTKVAEKGDIQDGAFQQGTQLQVTKLNSPIHRISG